MGTELHDYKALNVQDDSEWSAEPKLPTIVENATQQQINQNPYIKPPKLRKSWTISDKSWKLILSPFLEWLAVSQSVPFASSRIIRELSHMLRSDLLSFFKDMLSSRPSFSGIYTVNL